VEGFFETPKSRRARDALSQKINSPAAPSRQPATEEGRDKPAFLNNA
jgi:hypothetical protein